MKITDPKVVSHVECYCRLSRMVQRNQTHHQEMPPSWIVKHWRISQKNVYGKRDREVFGWVNLAVALNGEDYRFHVDVFQRSTHDHHENYSRGHPAALVL